MTEESQSTCASVEKRTGTDHGKLQKFYDMLDEGRYGELHRSLEESHNATDVKLGLEDMSYDEACSAVFHYDSRLSNIALELRREATRLAKCVMSESVKKQSVETMRSMLDEVERQRTDQERLRAIRRDIGQERLLIIERGVCTVNAEGRVDCIR